jgi:signal transduction histidine kinase
MSTMLFVFYRAPETRVVFGAFFFVALTFGLLRSGGLRLGLVGGFTLLAYAATSLARWLQGGGEEVLRMDILQFVSLFVALPWFVFIATLARKLREADHRKNAFLATIVHELRTPLAPILNGVRALQAWSGEASAHKVLPMMERQLGHMARLLDDLFDIAGIVQGKVDLRLKRIDLRTVIDEAVEVAGPLFEERRHQLIVSMPVTPMMIDADHLRLTQVLTNLLSNAAKYTPPGGRIELEVRPRDAAVEVTIRDNGMGIPRHKLRSIFEMYNQVATGSANRQPGLGIGLALVLQLVRLHGGRIEARSDGEGRGSEFSVWLPFDPHAQQSSRRASTGTA